MSKSTIIAKGDKLWHQLIVEAYGGKCAVCGDTRKPLCGHHIFGKQSHPHLRHDPHNGVCVCYGYPGNCHDLFHSLSHENAWTWLYHALPEQMAKLANAPRFAAPMLSEHAERVEWLAQCLTALAMAKEQRLTLREVDGKAFAVGR